MTTTTPSSTTHTARADLRSFLATLPHAPQNVALIDLFAEHGLPNEFDPLGSGRDFRLIAERVMAYDYMGPWWQPGPVGRALLEADPEAGPVVGERALVRVATPFSWESGVVVAVRLDGTTSVQIDDQDGRVIDAPTSEVVGLPRT